MSQLLLVCMLFPDLMELLFQCPMWYYNLIQGIRLSLYIQIKYTHFLFCNSLQYHLLKVGRNEFYLKLMGHHCIFPWLCYQLKLKFFILTSCYLYKLFLKHLKECPPYSQSYQSLASSTSLECNIKMFLVTVCFALKRDQI